MKYYFLKTTIEDDQSTQAVFAYDTEREATIAYHNETAAAMGYDTVKSIMCMVVNSDGVVLRSEHYERNDYNFIEPELVE